jgi:uncharacterized membrane protein (UPF0127 family)
LNTARVVWRRGAAVVSEGELMLAQTYWQRLRGLLGRPVLAPGVGLLIAPCASVHTFFMGCRIDVVYLSCDNVVQKLVPQLKPWRVSAARGASYVVELAAGQAAALKIQVGDVCDYS